MRLVSWNINGIRRPAAGVGRVLEALGADVVCLQETRVTRDLLDEPTAIVEGYNSYFSFSRGRSGYSGVATFCKDSATPVAAEEGLSGLLADNRGAIGCYGDTEGFTEDELRALDSEGRAVITQHRIRTSDKREKTLTVINVYCPHADPEKPERKTFKLRFYHLLKLRAEAILRAGSHVIILGDVNTSHRPIDHCDPSDPVRIEWPHLCLFLYHLSEDSSLSSNCQSFLTENISIHRAVECIPSICTTNPQLGNMT
uniref:exodeoxyribonuclease III n=1 Tax=Ornithorhynchus anatinus TaxID=9258 RepID=A0A6I8N6U4_ORNAN